jgi:acyl-CoA thioester hydrolase
MAKPDPALLDPSRYPFHCEIETRYRDLDSNLHINNGVLASLLEEGRVRFHRATQFGGLHGDARLSAMVVSAAIEYLGQSQFPAPLEMHVGAAKIGTSSYELCQLALQQGDVVTFGRVTMVCIKQGQPFRIPEAHRAKAVPWMLKL